MIYGYVRVTHRTGRRDPQAVSTMLEIRDFPKASFRPLHGGADCATNDSFRRALDLAAEVHRRQQSAGNRPRNAVACFWRLRDGSRSREFSGILFLVES
jgi:hypothetical protein